MSRVTGVGRVVIAGIGNIFLGDDAFGPAVIDELGRNPPADIEIIDAGIRGLHLAMDLADGVSAVVLVDAAQLHAAPGTVRLLEPDSTEATSATADAHSIDVPAVLTMLRRTCETPPRVVVVGCQPEHFDPAAPLSDAVLAAVGPAAALASAVALRLLGCPDDSLEHLDETADLAETERRIPT